MNFGKSATLGTYLEEIVMSKKIAGIIANTCASIIFIVMLSSCGGNYSKTITRGFEVEELKEISLTHYSKEMNSTESLSVDTIMDMEYVYSQFKAEHVKESPITNYKTGKSDCLEIYNVSFKFLKTSISECRIDYYVYGSTDGTVVYPDGTAYSFYGNAKCDTYDDIVDYLDSKKAKLSSLYSWVDDVKLGNIESVINYRGLGSISPSYQKYALNTFYQANGSEDIDKAYKFIKEAVVSKQTGPLLNGVGSQTLIYNLNDGTAHSITQIAMGFYVDDIYYEFENFPSFSAYYGNSFLKHCDFEVFKNGTDLNINYSDFKNFIFTSECGDYSQESQYSPYVIKNGDEEIHIIDHKTFYTLFESEKTIYQLIGEDTFDTILNY